MKKNTNKASNGGGGGGGHVRFTAPDDTNDEMEHHSHPPSPPPPRSSTSSPPPHHHSPPSSPPSKSATTKYSAKDLHGNMTRVQVDRDPLFYYEVHSILGVGSMGSVAKVRKRDAVVGGSARKAVQQHLDREKKLKTCFQIPILGPVFEYCMKLTGQDQDDFTRSQRSGGSDYSPNHSNNNSERGCGVWSSTRSSGDSSILRPRTNIIEDYNDGHGERPESVGGGGATSTNSVTARNSTTSSREAGIFYAMKSIHLSRVTDPIFIEELKNEIEILKTLDHPHVVRAMETFEYRNQIFIVMELNYGGDLYSRDPYTEGEAARITTSILSAVSYIHSMNIIHRDLKYENILFTNNSPKAEIKLIDFGLSAKFGSEDLTEGVGTMYVVPLLCNIFFFSPIDERIYSLY
jgi:serine/threonine protein kinase